MKQIYTIMKATVKIGFAIILIIVSTQLIIAQEMTSTGDHVNIYLGNDSAANANTESNSNHTAPSHKDGHSVKLKPKATHTLSLRTIPTLSKDELVIGNTYNRYGEQVFPSGYGIQVVAFKNLNNLQKYLHMYDNKELFIQVSSQDSTETHLYRVILGANGNKISVEKELNLFNNADIPAVLRRHKEIPLQTSKLD
jgi:hypothetical protein